MFDVVHKLCTSCNLFQVTKRNNFLCSYCSPNQKAITKEKIIKDLLEKNGLNFIHNKQFPNDCCLKYRPDFLFACGSYYTALEVDENRHEHYPQDCEIIRMNNISFGLDLPVKFIRYNPDLPGVRTKQKHIKLMEVLEKWLNCKSLDDPNPVYLFYD